MNANKGTIPYLGKLYFTGYDPKHSDTMEAASRARDALRNAGYEVVVGAIYDGASPNAEIIRECVGIATPDLPFGPANKSLDVEVAIAMTLGKDFYPVHQWVERAAEFRKAEADARAKWEAQEMAYFNQRDHREQMEQDEAYAKNVPEAVNLCDDPPEKIVLIEVSGDGFIHVNRNVWAADVKVVVEYL